MKKLKVAMSCDDVALDGWSTPKDLETLINYYNKKGFKGDAISTKAIESTNYIRLKIPKYILYQYMNYSSGGFSMYWSDFEVEVTANGYRFIKSTKTTSNTSSTVGNILKKGTEFLIAAVGGQLVAENIRIIGLYTI